MTFDFDKDRTRVLERAVARLFERRSESRLWRMPPVGESVEGWLRVVFLEDEPDTGDRGGRGRQGDSRDSRVMTWGDSMAPEEVQSVNEPINEVEMAAAATRRGIDRLVQLLGREHDDVVLAAMRALDDLGAKAVVGPLAAALRRADASHRGIIVCLLGSYGREERPRVLEALSLAQRRERDPMVADLIREALFELTPSDDAPGD